MKSNEDRKRSDKDNNIDEEISSNSNNSKNNNHKDSYHSRKMKEASLFNLDKNNKSEKTDFQKHNLNDTKDNNINNDELSIKKTRDLREN